MSQNEKGSLRKWLVIFGGILLAQTFTCVGIFVKDHFALEKLREQVAVLQPRVEELWWKSKTLKREEL